MSSVMFPYRGAFDIQAFGQPRDPRASSHPPITPPAAPPTAVKWTSSKKAFGVAPMSPAEADAAARRAMGSVYSNMQARGQALLGRYGAGIDALVAGARALDSGNPADIAWATTDAVLAAVALVPPVGTIISAIGKIAFGLVRWLVETYPAYQVQCTPSAISELCRTYLGRTDSAGEHNVYATVLRDERRFWIGSTHTRSTTSEGWRWAQNNENICKPYLPGVVPAGGGEGAYGASDMRFCTYMDRGTTAERMARLEIACRPIRAYKPGVPEPWGSRSWAEWESDVEHPERLQKLNDDMAAAVVAGQELRDQLIAKGDPRYVGRWTDLCAWYGFWIKLAGLPNESLVEILSRVAQTAPESLPDNVDPNTYIQLAPDQPGVVYWKDGLVEAYMRFFGWVPKTNKTYCVKALIDEYADRITSGAIRRPVVEARRVFRVEPGITQIAPSTGIPTVAIVGGVGVAALLAWALLG